MQCINFQPFPQKLFQCGEVSKQLANSTRLTSKTTTKERDDIKIQLEETQYKQNKLEESIQQSTNNIIEKLKYLIF